MQADCARGPDIVEVEPIGNRRHHVPAPVSGLDRSSGSAPSMFVNSTSMHSPARARRIRGSALFVAGGDQRDIGLVAGQGFDCSRCAATLGCRLRVVSPVSTKIMRVWDLQACVCRDTKARRRRSDRRSATPRPGRFGAALWASNCSGRHRQVHRCRYWSATGERVARCIPVGVCSASSDPTTRSTPH